ncbi:PulD Type II secretory pathway, component PulD [Burkholderiales bacterium]
MKRSLVCSALLSLVVGESVLAQGALSPATGPATPTVAPSVAMAQRGQPVMLAFRDVEIAEVVSAFSASMGLPFLVDARVKGRMTLEAPQPVSLSKAYELLVSTLSLQGFSVIRSDGFVRVVPATEAKLFVPGMSEGAGGMAAATRIFQLQHEDANQMMASIRALVPASNPITVNPGSNSLIISDTAENLGRIAEVISALDKPELGLLRVVVLQHAHVSDLMPTVDQLINAQRGQAAKGAVNQQTVSLLADAANNRLVLRSFSGAKLDQAERLVRELDTPLAKPGNVNVVYLKNAEAARLAITLQAIYTGVASSPSAPAPTTQPSQPKSGNTPASNTPAAVTLKAGVTIQPEPTLNALLVVAPPSIYKEIRSVIDQLDVRRAQVYIESLIVEVSADRAAEFGIQFQYLNGLNENTVEAIGGTNFNSRGGGTNLLDLAANPLAAGQGLNVGVIKGTVSFGGNTIANLGLLARALESQGGGNIIATPNLLTLDNEEAKIVIGQNVPFITGSFTTSGNNAGNPFQTIERKDVGTTLRVRPLVTEGGVIKLQIFQEVSSVSQRLSEGIITNKRSIESTVLVDDQQMVVLGGLIQDENNEGEGKVPGLGDIPLLGQLFRYDTTGRRKTNLFVFLRPVVIRTAEDSNRLTMGRYEAMQAQRAAQPARVNAPLLPDLGKPALPPAPTAPR